MCIGSQTQPIVATGGAGRAGGREYSSQPSTGGGMQLTGSERAQAMSVKGWQAGQQAQIAQRNESLGLSAASADTGGISSRDQAALDYRSGSTNAALLTAGNKLLGG